MCHKQHKVIREGKQGWPVWLAQPIQLHLRRSTRQIVDRSSYFGARSASLPLLERCSCLSKALGRTSFVLGGAERGHLLAVSSVCAASHTVLYIVFPTTALHCNGVRRTRACDRVEATLRNAFLLRIIAHLFCACMRLSCYCNHPS
jgi:hypothetical protein